MFDKIDNAFIVRTQVIAQRFGRDNLINLFFASANITIFSVIFLIVVGILINESRVEYLIPVLLFLNYEYNNIEKTFLKQLNSGNRKNKRCCLLVLLTSLLAVLFLSVNVSEFEGWILFFGFLCSFCSLLYLLSIEYLMGTTN